MGCSFGGYHADNIALRHPDIFTGLAHHVRRIRFLNFLDGYYDQDCYFNLPTHYLPNLSDPWFFDHYRRNMLHPGHRLGRPVPRPEPEPRPHHEFQGNSPQTLHLGDLELP